MITEYTDTLKNITPKMLEGFFVGWPNPPSLETHFKILKQSSHLVLAIADDKVIGFINAISDGVLSAYIPLLEVLPKYKNKGIGSELVKRMKDKLKNFYMIDLSCDKDVQSFYRKLGFTESSGMMIRNYERQSGKR